MDEDSDYEEFRETAELFIPTPTEGMLTILGDVFAMENDDVRSGLITPPVPVERDITPFSGGDNYFVPRDPSTDIQGIQWQYSSVAREEFRRIRTAEYMAHDHRYPTAASVIDSRPAKHPLITAISMNRMTPCSVNHFQLRHLISAPTNSQVIFLGESNRIIEWDPIRGEDVVLLNYPGISSFSRPTTLCATPELMLVGGFYGDAVLMRDHLYQPNEKSNPHLLRIAPEENGLINHIASMPKSSFFYISSNDCAVRQLDASCGKIVRTIRNVTAPNVYYFHRTLFPRQQQSIQYYPCSPLLMTQSLLI